ncbi:MAG TPA: nucleoside hydrolase [Geminicoccaceae bacterium]
MTDARPILIDCDPGQDDALALLLAFASPELEVLAVTTVAGNVPLALTAANARRIAELAGRPDVPVHAGCAAPLIRPLVTAEHIHGQTGLEGADLPPPTIPLQSEHAVDAIVRILRERPPGSVTLCPIGPLTNLAMAFRKAPDIVPRAAEIVLMGGALGEGNVTPSAEFNIHADPHAARIVFESGVRIVMHGLDVTRQALATPDRLAAIRALGTRVGHAAAGLLEFYNVYHRTRRGRVGAPLHDPCAIAWLLRPELFEGRDCAVDVETAGEFTLGRTVVDWSGRTGRTPNARVVTRIDADGFFALLTERLARLTPP